MKTTTNSIEIEKISLWFYESLDKRFTIRASMEFGAWVVYDRRTGAGGNENVTKKDCFNSLEFAKSYICSFYEGNEG